MKLRGESNREHKTQRERNIEKQKEIIEREDRRR